MLGLARLMILVGVCLLGLAVPFSAKSQAQANRGQCTALVNCTQYGTINGCTFSSGFVPTCYGTFGACSNQAKNYGCNGVTSTYMQCVVIISGC